MDLIKYVEKCTGTNHDGPAWIARVQTSKSGRTVYFEGHALQRSSRSQHQGGHVDIETGEQYWISGIKARGSNRHWAGSGPIFVEESVVPQLLEVLGRSSLDASRFRITPDLPRTDPQKFNRLLNEKL